MSEFLLNKVSFTNPSYKAKVSFNSIMPAQRSRNNRLSKNQCGFKRIYNIEIRCIEASLMHTLIGILSDRVDYIGPTDGDIFTSRGVAPTVSGTAVVVDTSTYFDAYITVAGGNTEYLYPSAECVTAWVRSGTASDLDGWDYHLVTRDGLSMVNGEIAASPMSFSGSSIIMGAGDYSNVAIYGFIPYEDYTAAIYDNVRAGGSNPTPSRFPTVKFAGFEESHCVATSIKGNMLESGHAFYSLDLVLEELI